MRRNGKKESYWRGVIAEAGASGLGVRAFCRASGVNESLFYFWRRELRLRDAEGSRQSGFVELVPATACGSGSGVCIRIDERVSIALERDFDGATLRSALDCLLAGAAGR